MQVLKFGGTSLATVDRICTAAQIVNQHQQSAAVTVVVSAMAGVTDMLLQVGQGAIARRNDWHDAVAEVLARHQYVYRELTDTGTQLGQLHQQWSLVLADIAQLCQHGSSGNGERDHQQAMRFSGWGERLMTVLFAAVLRTHGIVAVAFTEAPVILAGLATGPAELMPTASVLATRAWLAPQLASLRQRGGIPVLPGYIARDAQGAPTTVGRNGSDYSAAVIASALGADAVYMYSDVAGIYSADPQRVADAVRYPLLTYTQAALLAAQGAKVLHPRTVEPLVQGSIPLFLRSAYQPEAPGTDIVPDGVVSLGTGR